MCLLKLELFRFFDFLTQTTFVRKKQPHRAQGRYMGTELQADRSLTILDRDLKKTKIYYIILITNLDTFNMSCYLPFSFPFPSCRSVMIANRRIGRQNGRTRRHRAGVKGGRIGRLFWASRFLWPRTFVITF